MGGLGIVAGRGDLPRLLAEDCAGRGATCRVVTFAGVDLPWAGDHAAIPARFEQPQALFSALRAAGCDRVVFAGAMDRPALDPAAMDATFQSYAPRLMPALAAGDDAVLRIVLSMFTDAGFDIVTPQDCLGALLRPAGVLGKTQPSAADRADAARAARIVAELGRLDIGQGAVVAQGLCLAMETLPGTDAMLGFVAGLDRERLPDAEGAKGVLFKAPKPAQDQRIDLPAIGLDTLHGAAKAGLAGVVTQAHGVLHIGGDALVVEADRLGLFLWSRAPDEDR